MGMYSDYRGQKIKIKSKKALKEYKKMVEEEHKFFDSRITNIITDDGNIDFQEWDSNKLEGYWLPETKLLLNDIAEFITGWVVFEYECYYLFRLIFKNNKVYIQREPEIDERPVLKEEFWKQYKIEKL